MPCEQILNSIAVGLLEILAGDITAVSREQSIRHRAQRVFRR